MIKACFSKSEDAVWTLTYLLNKDGTINIQNFDKDDNDGYMFKDQLATIDFIKETEGRIVEAVSIDGVEYAVSNPQNVFSYKQPL